MAVCCVKTCQNNQLVKQTPEKKHFFRFPVNEARKRLWMKILRVENAGPNSRICMLHFRDDEIDYTSPFRALLSKMALPSLEPIPRPPRNFRSMPPKPHFSQKVQNPSNIKIDNSQLLKILQSPNMQLEQNGQPLQIKLVPQAGASTSPQPSPANNFGMHFMANSQAPSQQPLQIKFVPQNNSPNAPMSVKFVPQQNTQQPIVQFVPQQNQAQQMAIKFVPQGNQASPPNQQNLAVKFVPQNGPQGQQMQIKLVPQQNGQPMGILVPPGKQGGNDMQQMSFKFVPQQNGRQNNMPHKKNKILEEYQHVLKQNGVTLQPSKEETEMQQGPPKLIPFQSMSRQHNFPSSLPRIQAVQSLAEDDEDYGERRHRRILSSDAREMVWNVYKYFKMNGSPKAMQATSEACRVPVRTLSRILQTARNVHLNMHPAFESIPPIRRAPPFRGPPNEFPRDPPYKLGSAALDRVRQVINNYKCIGESYPTIFQLYDEVQKYMYFPGDIQVFRNVLRAMGYRWKRRGEHVVLYEQIGEKHWRNVFGMQRRRNMENKQDIGIPIEPQVIVKEEPEEEAMDQEQNEMDAKQAEEAEDSFDSEYEYQESENQGNSRNNGRVKQEPSEGYEDDGYKDLSEFYTVEQHEYSQDQDNPEQYNQEEFNQEHGDYSQDQGDYSQDQGEFNQDQEDYNDGQEDGNFNQEQEENDYNQERGNFKQEQSDYEQDQGEYYPDDQNGEEQGDGEGYSEEPVDGFMEDQSYY